MGVITILGAVNGGNAAKTFTRAEDGTFSSKDYAVGSTFAWHTADITSVADVAEVVRNLAHNEFIVAGHVQEPLGPHGLPRKLISRNGDTLFPRVNGVKQSVGATVRQWGMIDLDGLELPDHFDLTTEGADAIEWAIYEYLPPCFHDVTCFWQLSSSAGIKPDLRAHLWFWWNRPVKGGWIAKWFVADDVPADPVVFRSDVQPHYAVDPLFTNCPDPIRNRSGMLEREHDAVALPERKEQELVATAKSLGRGNALLDDAHGFEAKLELIGDGSGLSGFHQPIRDAIMAAVGDAIRNGQSVDAEALKARVREATLAAQRSPGRPNSDIERYCSDETLDASIKGAVEKAEAQIAEEWADRTAYYPVPKGTTAEAEIKIRAAMTRFRYDAQTFAQDTLADQERQTVELAELAELAAGFPPQAPLIHVTPIDSLLITPTGSGKSTLARQIIVPMLDDHPGKCVGIGSPRHALNDEHAADLRRRLDGGRTVEVYRGMNAEDPTAPFENEDPGAKRLRMCRISETVGAVVGAGGAADALCKKGDAKNPGCPHFSTCGHLKQKKKRADVWLFAHNVLAKTKPSCIGELAAVFVDENPRDVFMGGVGGAPVVLTFGEMRDIADGLKKLENRFTLDGYYNSAADAHAERLRLEALRTSLENMDDGKVETADLPAVESARMIWKLALELDVGPATPRRELEAEIALKGPFNSAIRRVFQLLEIVKAAEGETTVGLKKTEQGLIMSWLIGVGSGFDVPTMYMDATGRPEIYKAMFPTIADDRITIVDVAAPYMHVRQVTDWNASRNKLLPGYKEAKQTKTAFNNIEKLRAVIEVEAARLRGQGGKINGKRIDVLVATYKATRELLEAGALPNNVEVAHFGNITGIDRWKGVRGLIVAGSAMVGVDDVECLAELIKGVPLEALDHAYGNWFAVEKVGGRRRGEAGGPGLTRTFHNDPIAEAVRWTMVEGVLIQVYGRGREIRRTAANPLAVTILCDTPLPLEVDEFVTWAEVQASPYDIMKARGVIMDAPTTARGFWGVVGAVLGEDPGRLKERFKKEQLRSLTGDIAYKYTSISVVPRERSEPLPGPEYGKAKVKLGRYAVPLRYSARADLSALFGPEAVITLLAEPQITPVVVPETFPRTATDIRLGYPHAHPATRH